MGVVVSETGLSMSGICCGRVDCRDGGLLLYWFAEGLGHTGIAVF
jgi:hypothetical protein